MLRPFKYLAVFSLPLTVLIALNAYGWLTYLPLLLFFGLVPLVELLISPDRSNLDDQEKLLVEKDNTYDLLLFLTVPIQIILLIIFLQTIDEVGLTTAEIIGRITAMGLMCGVIGINVGHELGHRPPGFAHLMGEILMLTSLENHFIPYHNRGHHFNVATPNDPATARLNEPVYLFWFRSQIGSYFQAWSIERERLEKQGKSWLSLKNKMIINTILHLLLLTSIYFFFGFFVLLAFLAAAAFGIILLETVNYIEHYGLLRSKNEKGRFERVRHQHSWNSDNIIGRVVLFELSRHSDHHYKASKHYQLLDSVEASPQMPTGYPGMMIFSLIPPLWFNYMNRRIREFQNL